MDFIQWMKLISHSVYRSTHGYKKKWRSEQKSIWSRITVNWRGHAWQRGTPIRQREFSQTTLMYRIQLNLKLYRLSTYSSSTLNWSLHNLKSPSRLLGTKTQFDNRIMLYSSILPNMPNQENEWFYCSSFIRSYVFIWNSRALLVLLNICLCNIILVEGFSNNPVWSTGLSYCVHLSLELSDRNKRKFSKRPVSDQMWWFYFLPDTPNIFKPFIEELIHNTRSGLTNVWSFIYFWVTRPHRSAQTRRRISVMWWWINDTFIFHFISLMTVPMLQEHQKGFSHNFLCFFFVFLFPALASLPFKFHIAD